MIRKLVICLLFAVVCLNFAGATTCGGNCPGGCRSCPCGYTKNVLSSAQISAMCRKSALWSQGCCECIIKHESGGNTNAVNQNSNGSYDVGLWQINDFNWKACNGGSTPCGTSANLRCAEDVFRWGSYTWKLWSTCSVCGCCHSK